MKSILVAWLLLAASGRAAGQAPPALPEWTLNLARSTFDPGPPPKSITTTLFTAGRHVKVVSKIVDAKNRVSVVEYRAAPDGEEVPVTGTRAYDSVSIKSIDANTTEATRRKNGKVVQV